VGWTCRCSTRWCGPAATRPTSSRQPPASHRSLEDELASVRATPADRVHAELDLAFRGRPLPARIEVALADGEQVFLMRVAEALERFWHAAIEPWWPAIRAVLDNDIAYRGRVLTSHGAAVALTQLDRTMGWEDSCLQIAVAATLDADWASDGVIFSPSVFGGPRVYYTLQPWNQSVIYYPARNVVNEGALRPGDGGRSAVELIGHTRAMILAQLDQPRSTRDLAARLGLSPSTVSYHLGVLYRWAAGAVTPRQRGLVGSCGTGLGGPRTDQQMPMSPIRADRW
jgi:DNA-binding transcriptional ArsR family regulator